MTTDFLSVFNISGTLCVCRPFLRLYFRKRRKTLRVSLANKRKKRNWAEGRRRRRLPPMFVQWMTGGVFFFFFFGHKEKRVREALNYMQPSEWMRGGKLGKRDRATTTADTRDAFLLKFKLSVGCLTCQLACQRRGNDGAVSTAPSSATISHGLKCEIRCQRVSVWWCRSLLVYCRMCDQRVIQSVWITRLLFLKQISSTCFV